jgi:hypothetical protein
MEPGEELENSGPGHSPAPVARVDAKRVLNEADARMHEDGLGNVVGWAGVAQQSARRKTALRQTLADVDALRDLLSRRCIAQFIISRDFTCRECRGEGHTPDTVEHRGGCEVGAALAVGKA